ncbi:MAG: hypothetical protein R2824_09370 [Saprospiraceae bacterium]|nr:hypothetical protein [Lewinella sp.]
MKLHFIITAFTLITFMHTARAQKEPIRLADDVAGILAAGNNTPVHKLAAELSAKIVRKYKWQSPKKPVIEAIGTLIDLRRDQRLPEGLRAHAYELNDHLIAGLISSVQSSPSGEDIECREATNNLNSALEDLMKKIKTYMDCMAKNSKSGYPKSRNYDNRNGRFLGAPSPPPGDDDEEESVSRPGKIFPGPTPPRGGSPGLSGSSKHPCQDAYDALDLAKAKVERLGRTVQQSCK